ncbi:hypothetical protein HHL11_12090 [Ramlibacter sp. G-1-2-2]|uniref:DUF5666 domain-containing protein n=1 Tax=Ramlibacter agri TaxID=2728837 RepID=A0A848H0K4_9BURK|nr:DUF5666 domain-containing protein [Ramlibacter agri]NML44496.1 hypothetical protein [Ramlibacter agri]
MKPMHRVLAVVFTLLLLSCGGGAGIGGADVAGTGAGGGGVGTGGTGIVAGTVTGLGSVVVEGTRFDDSQAVLESLPDLVHATSLALSDLHIGQYAYVSLDAGGTPARVRIESQLVGFAAAVDAAGGRLSLGGQPVLVNADPGSGPVTVFDGFTTLADVHAGDPLQVYGVLQGGAGAGDQLRATRIEKLAAAGVLPARVTGTLQQGSGSTLLLAGRPLDVSGAVGVPTLSPGTAVIAIVPWTTQLPASWQATAVALLAPAATSSLRVSGAVHVLAGNHAVVQGVDVDLSALPQAQRDAVREGSYLTVEGRAPGDDGRRLDAARVETLAPGGRSAQLRGSITTVTGTTSFVVRGQAVDASTATFDGASAAGLTVGTFVEVEGVQRADGVMARKVTIPGATPDRAVLELSGTIQAVDAASRVARLLARDGRVLELVLPAGKALPAVGAAVSAEGYWDGTRLQVRELEPDDSGGGGGDHGGGNGR